jgi:ABC-type bacteriocin/lantibiotic exporter with double-glycine peptidase domain
VHPTAPQLNLSMPPLRLTKSKPSARRWALARIVIALLSLGCASYGGTAKPAEPVVLDREGEWIMVRNFPQVLQDRNDDCGAAALASVLRFWGHSATPRSILNALGRADHRLRAGDMTTYTRKLGLRSYVFFGTMNDVVHELKRGRPIIVGLGKRFAEKKALSHYEVVIGYEPKKKLVLLLDPGKGFQVDSLEGFAEEWTRTKGVTIVTFLPESAAPESKPAVATVR